MNFVMELNGISYTEGKLNVLLTIYCYSREFRNQIILKLWILILSTLIWFLDYH